MSRNDVQWSEVTCSINRLESGDVRLQLEFDDRAVEARYTKEQIGTWLDTPKAMPAQSQLASTFLAAFADLSPTPAPSCRLRLCLDIVDVELSGLPWEQYLRPVKLPIVRVAPVPMRHGEIPFVLPLRIAHLRTAPGFSVQRIVASIFKRIALRDVPEAICVKSPFTLDLDQVCRANAWPVADIVHLDRPPLNARAHEPLSMSEPGRPNTLGWLARQLDTWRSRLLVVNCNTRDEAILARRAAARLVARGGPAIVVGSVAKSAARGFYQRLYNAIIHDFPLGEALEIAMQPMRRSGPSLIVGGVRESAVRVSAPIVELDKLLARTRDVWKRGAARSSLQGRVSVQAEDLPVLERILPYLGSGVPSKSIWHKYQFSLRESGGLLPLSKDITKIRRSVRRGALTWDRDLARRLSTGERHVNTGLYQLDSDQVPRRLPPRGARLIRGEVYQLGVHVGNKDDFNPTLRAGAFLEEVVGWQPGQRGVWLEVGLTGIDFRVLGDAVQELWLASPSEKTWWAGTPIYFSIVPEGKEISCLRLCVYYRQNIVQSFRLAAAMAAPPQAASPSPIPRDALAQALGVKPRELGANGYATRLEFSQVASADNIEALSPRQFSLVTNDIDSRMGITFKADDLLEVNFRENLPGTISEARREIESLLDPKVYSFSANLDDLLDKAFDETLPVLAAHGWSMYSTIFSGKARAWLGKSNSNVPATIGEVSPQSGIPWPLMYTREFDKDSEGGYVACHAAIPSDEGPLAANRCGEHKECPLHASHQSKWSPEHVACPLHFWGFNFLLENPVGQALGTLRPPRLAGDAIQHHGTVHVAAGYHTGLSLYNSHRQELEALLDKSIANLKPAGLTRDTVLGYLYDCDLHVVYLYCHASAATEASVCQLTFRNSKGNDMPIKCADLRHPKDPFKNRPLVFLNGCQTAGGIRSISQFVTALTNDRGAAAVVGTEVKLPEALAGDMAREFFTAFVRESKSAGEALLTARRELLRKKKNPLGLVYTLFGIAELRLREDA